MKTRLFLFDLDGTLVSTGGAGSRALTRAFATLHNIDNAHTFVNMSGKTDHAIFREIMRSAQRGEITAEELFRISQIYLCHLEDEMKTAAVKILRGAMEFVTKTAGCPHILAGLGTGNLERGARLKLGPTGFNSFFSFGGFGSDAEDRAEMLRVGHHRAETLIGGKIADRDVFVIGDTPLDVGAARRNGFTAVAVATGGSSYDVLSGSRPDFLFHDLTEADDLLQVEINPSLERA
jgi:phosphoglycolate phosphatase-like HAD superfamily hydrolase